MAYDQKSRFWWFLLYPESAPNDWIDRITLTGLPAAISPLHDKDINSDGSLKKPHHHVILAYNGPTTFNNVKRFSVKELNGTIPKVIASMLKPYEYLWHKNNQEKAQYNPSELLLVNDFNILDYTLKSSTQSLELQFDICNDIDKWKIQEYYSLVRIYQFTDVDKFVYVTGHSLFFKTYITSRKFVTKEEVKLIESLTGVDDEEKRED